MGKNYELKIGDRVDLCVNDKDFYRADIQEMKDGKTIYVSVPTYRSILVNLHEEQLLNLYYCRDTGRYCVDVQIIRLGQIGNVPVAEMEIKSLPRKEQRRRAFRVPAAIKAIVCLPFDDSNDENIILPENSGDKEIAYTRDISETGVALVMGKPCGIGSKLLLELYLPTIPEKDQPLYIMAEVRRESYNAVKKTYQIGLQFLELNERTSSILSKYTLARQQQLIVQQRLVEGS